MSGPEEYVTISVPRATARALTFYSGEITQAVREWATEGMRARVLTGAPDEGEIRNERVVLAVIGGMADTLGAVAECAANPPVRIDVAGDES